MLFHQQQTLRLVANMPHDEPLPFTLYYQRFLRRWHVAFSDDMALLMPDPATEILRQAVPLRWQAPEIIFNPLNAPSIGKRDPPVPSKNYDALIQFLKHLLRESKLVPQLRDCFGVSVSLNQVRAKQVQ